VKIINSKNILLTLEKQKAIGAFQKVILESSVTRTKSLVVKKNIYS
jgi:hypothetical protein